MKKISKLNQTGSHMVAVLVVIVVIAAVGFAGWRVMSSKKADNPTANTTTTSKNTSQQSDTTSNVTWEWMGSEWKASGTAPACPSPLALAQSPADVSKATAILYPGQTRGGNYKPHGGFRFGQDNNVTVKAPLDAKLYEGSRYIEAGEVQYLLVFQAPCGLSYRFDHLLTLTDKFQKAVDETLPAAKVDDSRTTKFTSDITVKAGETVASAAGFAKTKNASFDFGVYDLRKRNQAAASESYVNQHQNELSQAAYGLCWLDILPVKDSGMVKALPGGDGAAGKTSDYCQGT